MKDIIRIYETEDDEKTHIEINEDEIKEIGIDDFFTIIIKNIVKKIVDISIEMGKELEEVGKESETYWKNYSEKILTEEELNKDKTYFTKAAEIVDRVIKDKKQITKEQLEKYVKDKTEQKRKKR